MAVEDKYVDSNVAAGKLATTLVAGSAKVYAAAVTFEVANADSNGSVYRLIKNMPGELVPLDIKILADSALDGTDFDLGFYATGIGGAEKDKDCLADGFDPSSGFARGSEANGLSAVAIEDVDKKIYELAGDTYDTRENGYDLCVTANAAGTAGGTISIIALFGQG